MTERSRDRLGRPVEADDPAMFDPHVDVDAPRSGHQSLALAQQLLDDGLPFTAHEVLEAQWKACAAQERELWQGLAQLAVAVTHRLRGNGIGATRLLDRAAGHLGSPDATASAARYGVDIDGAIKQARLGAPISFSAGPDPALPKP